MTKLLDKAIEEVRKLPANRQDEAAEMLLFLAAQEKSDLRLSSDQEAEIKRRMEGEPHYLSDTEVRALFKRLGA